MAPLPCPLCNTPTTLALRGRDHRLGDAETYEIWRCPRCGLGRTHPPLDPSVRRTIYPPDYPDHHQISQPARGWHRPLAAAALSDLGYPQPDAPPLPAVLTQPLAALRSWTWRPPLPPPGRLLDIGCGSGAYGASLLRLGWRVDGIEPNAAAAERARGVGLNVQSCDLQVAILPPTAYDAITLWHVLEHLDDPIASLRLLRPALRLRGQLWLEVPNWAGLMAALTRSHWFHLDLPRHRFHFTPTSLRLALEQSGFRVERLWHIPNPHGFRGALAYRWNPSLHRSRPLLLLGWLLGSASAALHRADILRALAIPATP